MAQTTVRKLIQAAAFVVLLTGTAAAQIPMTMPLGGNKPPPTPEEVERQKAIERAYKSTTDKIPEKHVTDPWASVRSAPNSSATAKKNQQ